MICITWNRDEVWRVTSGPDYCGGKRFKRSSVHPKICRDDCLLTVDLMGSTTRPFGHG